MIEINSLLYAPLMKVKQSVLISLMLLFMTTASINAQRIVVSSSENHIVYKQFDERPDFWLVMMYDITAISEIKVVLPESSLTVNWVRYPDLQFMSNQTTLSPDDHTGYIAQINGTVNGKPYNKELVVWVIDYKRYQPVFNTLTPADPREGMCDLLTLALEGKVPEMFYKTPDNTTVKLHRNFEVHYESLEWEDAWKTIELIQPVAIQDGFISITNPPYKDTYFTLSGDQFANDIGVAPAVIKSSYYSAIRVKIKIKTEATVRTEKNEGDRPESITTISGSAPLEINFSANGNEPVASYYQWQIFSEGDAFITRTDESHRFTFTQAGTYLVKLRAENAYCSATDSLTIKISESSISAPNVFTPNGDGINDEFRVAYKSIIEFDCWVFNRWGSKIVHWNDPQKGWDGTVNGKPASEGAYFYVIKALGSDGLVYNLKGDINLLRGMP